METIRDVLNNAGGYTGLFVFIGIIAAAVTVGVLTVVDLVRTRGPKASTKTRPYGRAEEESAPARTAEKRRESNKVAKRFNFLTKRAKADEVKKTEPNKELTAKLPVAEIPTEKNPIDSAPQLSADKSSTNGTVAVETSGVSAKQPGQQIGPSVKQAVAEAEKTPIDAAPANTAPKPSPDQPPMPKLPTDGVVATPDIAAKQTAPEIVPPITSAEAAAGEKNSIMETKPPIDSSKSASVSPGTAQAPMATAVPNKAIDPEPREQKGKAGDLSDLFARKVEENTETNRLAEGMDEVDINDLLSKGTELVGKMRKPKT